MSISVRYKIYRTLKLVNIPQPVRYEIYTLAFPFDLRCESGILCSTFWSDPLSDQTGTSISQHKSALEAVLHITGNLGKSSVICQTYNTKSIHSLNFPPPVNLPTIRYLNFSFPTQEQCNTSLVLKVDNMQPLYKH